MYERNITIKPCVVGWGVYGDQHYYGGGLIKPLYHTAKTLKDCIKYCEEQKMEYQIVDHLVNNLEKLSKVKRE